MTAGPLLVFGPRSTSYDFGPFHPLTPRRFGPGIDLLRTVGAEPGLAPEPASDDDLLLVHTARYVAAVKRLSADPDGRPEAGIGPGDDPAFAGMHAAAATVAGGSLRAVEAILRGDVEHAFHPGGGLHHAMPDRASGFCIYDDPALAIARARAAGLRVLYVDLDVHHGDGVQAIHASDPGVMTISFHESGRYLFPGTGFAGELGSGQAAGTVVNVPLEPMTGETAWLDAVSSLVPVLAAAFGPDLVVSQHGADSHAWDPLAHLRVTTTAMGAAARLVDTVAHGWGTGAWLATGGGGYDAYRVVPRAWALTWLAGAHRDEPVEIPTTWGARWAAEADRYRQSPLPELLNDGPNAGLPTDPGQAAADARSLEMASLVRSIVVPGLLREAVERGWWHPTGGRAAASAGGGAATGSGQTPTVVGRLDRALLDRAGLAPRVVPPADRDTGLAIVRAAVDAGAVVVGAMAGDAVVGIAMADDGSGGAGAGPSPVARLIALGVAPEHRSSGLGRALLGRLLDDLPAGRPIVATVTVGERDPVEPEDAGVRRSIAERLLRASGFRVAGAAGALGRTDPWAITGERPAGERSAGERSTGERPPS